MVGFIFIAIKTIFLASLANGSVRFCLNFKK